LQGQTNVFELEEKKYKNNGTKFLGCILNALGKVLKEFQKHLKQWNRKTSNDNINLLV